jgi:hypothetical protein
LPQESKALLKVKWEGNVEVKKIIVELDEQITRLKEARSLLAGVETGPKRRGRPPGKSTGKGNGRKRHLSAEGRKRISEALKRRWAARRKAAGKTAKAA